jgi:multiple sugar transport system ATP-binding protein
MNLFDFELNEAGAIVSDGEVPLPRETIAACRADGNQVTLGFRPEDVDVVGDGQGIPLVVDVIEELGSDAFIYGHLPEQDVLTAKPVIARIDPRTTIERGHTVHLQVRPHRVHAFSTVTGERLPG